jgi:hypothetical protein
MLTRRGFLGWLAGAIPVAAVSRAAHGAAVAHLGAAPETLDALAEAILPSALGKAEARRIAAGFRRWMDGYREGAERLHAYGGSRLTVTGPTPATRWVGQLDALESAARSSGGKPFAALSVADRQAIVRPLLAGERGAGIPASPDAATHVAAGLLSFFYSSSAATDLCYEVAIGRNQCRPLADSPKQPRPRAKAPAGRMLPIQSTVEGGS